MRRGGWLIGVNAAYDHDVMRRGGRFKPRGVLGLMPWRLRGLGARGARHEHTPSRHGPWAFRVGGSGQCFRGKGVCGRAGRRAHSKSIGGGCVGPSETQTWPSATDMPSEAKGRQGGARPEVGESLEVRIDPKK